MLNLFVVVVLKHLVPFSPNFRAGVVIQWNLQCQLQNCCDHLQFSPMVVIDTTSRDSIFIEETVQKWCKKMGKMRLALLFQKMYKQLSTAKRPRSLKSVQEYSDGINLDENGEIQLTTNIFKAFFFFCGINSHLWTEAVIEDSTSNAICSVRSDVIAIKGAPRAPDNVVAPIHIMNIVLAKKVPFKAICFADVFQSPNLLIIL